MVDEPQLLQEKAEPRHNEAQSHQCQAGANPCEATCARLAKIGALPALLLIVLIRTALGDRPGGGPTANERADLVP